MSERRRLVLLILIMAVIAAIITVTSVVSLYRVAFQEQQARLVDTAVSRARLIEAIARFDAMYSTDYPGGSRQATMSQITDAHAQFQGFGETGEFTLARLEGDSIDYLLRHRHSSIEHPPPIPFDTELAEPMRRALSGMSGTMVGLDYRDEQVLAAYEPLPELNMGIVAKIDMEEVQAPFIKAIFMAISISLILVIIGAGLFLRVTNPMIRQLEENEDRLRRMNEELEQRVEERTKELVDAQEQLVRKEKLAILGELAGGVGHELRNPLGAIKNAAYFLNMALEKPEPDVKETIEILQKEVATSEKIISSLLGFARPQPPSLRKANINEVMQEALTRVTRPKQVKLRSQLNEELPIIQTDRDQLRQVFDNLILNAVQAMPEGGQLSVRSDLGDKEWITVSVSDTGPGISKENLSKIFEPLFTTKAKGIGLGLAITRTLIEGLGGSIEVQSTDGQGATFTVRIPVDTQGVG